MGGGKQNNNQDNIMPPAIKEEEDEDVVAEIAAKKNRERFAINKSYSIEVIFIRILDTINTFEKPYHMFELHFRLSTFEFNIFPVPFISARQPCDSTTGKAFI